jgi:hypothetical protein
VTVSEDEVKSYPYCFRFSQWLTVDVDFVLVLCYVVVDIGVHVSQIHAAFKMMATSPTSTQCNYPRAELTFFPHHFNLPCHHVSVMEAYGT